MILTRAFLIVCEIIGGLNHVAVNMWPDINYAVSTLVQFSLTTEKSIAHLSNTFCATSKSLWIPEFVSQRILPPCVLCLRMLMQTMLMM